MQPDEKNLLRRITSKLRKQDQRVCRTREGSRDRLSLGSYYILDIFRNVVFDYQVDIEDLGRELGVLSGGSRAAV